MKNITEYITEAKNEILLRGGMYNDEDWNNLVEYCKKHCARVGRLNEPLSDDDAEVMAADIYLMAQKKSHKNAPKVDSNKVQNYIAQLGDWSLKISESSEENEKPLSISEGRTPMTEEELEIIRCEFPDWDAKITKGKGTISMTKGKYNATISRPRRFNGTYWFGVWAPNYLYKVTGNEERRRPVGQGDATVEGGRKGELKTFEQLLARMHRCKYFDYTGRRPMSNNEFETIKKEFPGWQVKMTKGKGTISMINDKYSATVSRPKRLNGAYWFGVWAPNYLYKVTGNADRRRPVGQGSSTVEGGVNGELKTFEQLLARMHNCKYFK